MLRTRERRMTQGEHHPALRTKGCTMMEDASKKKTIAILRGKDSEW
jgi:hypothetical protein